MVKIRPYIYEAVDSIFKYFQTSSGNPIVAMPTGTGKSIVLAEFLRQLYAKWPDQRVLVLTHVKELIKQDYDKLKLVWPTAPVGIYSAGLKEKNHRMKITIGGVGSIVNIVHNIHKIDLVIIDEAHLVSPKSSTMYGTILSNLLKKNPKLKVIGLTATPWRLGQGLLTDDGIFTDFCYDITGIRAFNKLIKDGYLSPLIPKKTQLTFDVSNVTISGGDYLLSELQQVVNRDKLTFKALKETLHLTHDRNHVLCYTSGIAHAESTVRIFDSLGVEARMVHSKMSTEERDENIQDFVDGKYKFLVNNNILTTGFDMPSLDAIVVLRPTTSPVLWVQCLGRGTRIAPEKENCLVLDFAGNTKRLGPINDPCIPSGRKGKRKGSAPVRDCPACNCINHITVRKCIACGYEFTFETKITETSSEEQLIRFEDNFKTEKYKVDYIYYSKHFKKNRPPSLKVEYHCKLNHFSEYICLEHEGTPRNNARRWWRERMDSAAPETIDEAIKLAPQLKTPFEIEVWSKGTFPEITGYTFDSESDSAEPPRGTTSYSDFDEDDIPF